MGEAKDVEAFRRMLEWPQTRLSALKQHGRHLYDLLIRPAKPRLAKARRLLVSPDGDLNLVPFEALVDEDGHYVVERYAVSYLTTGRDLLRFPVARLSQSGPLIVADPRFGEPQQAVTVTTTARRSVTSAGDLSRVYFAPLAGTAEEARMIKALFPAARVLTGAATPLFGHSTGAKTP